MEEINQEMASGTKKVSGAEERKEDLIAILSYIGILFLVPLLVSKDNEFAQFHAKQGLVLFLYNLISGAILVIPLLGWIVGAVLMMGSFVMMVIGIVNVLKGEKKPLPLIGKYAGKLGI